MANNQARFQYDAGNLGTIQTYISTERIAAYLLHNNGDVKKAVMDYEHNTCLSEALYGVLQGFEITLRNAVHNRMSKQLGVPNWYEQIELERVELDALQYAREKIAEHGHAIAPGRMVAELNLSFWVRMTASVYEKTIWVPHLFAIFPIRADRRAVWERFDVIKKLRNRIAHHERIIYRRDLQQDYAQIIQATSWLSKPIATWIDATNCFQERFNKWKAPVDANPENAPPAG